MVGALRPLEDYLSIGRDRGVSWTLPRERVLAFLWSSGKPWAIYGVAKALSEEGAPVHANSVYRAMLRLNRAGLVVQVATLRRYLISPDPLRSDWCLLICSACGRLSTLDLPFIGRHLRSRSEDAGMQPTATFLECSGRCSKCKEVTSASP